MPNTTTTPEAAAALQRIADDVESGDFFFEGGIIPAGSKLYFSQEAAESMALSILDLIQRSE